jgi:hypothetical protein
MTTTEDAAFARQREIWANLYGPAETAELLEEAAKWLASHPDTTPEQAFREVDPEDDEEYRDFVATRW